MRKQTEIQLILERPHLYLPGIREAYGIKDETASAIVFGSQSIYRRENFFICREGWLPIVSAFAEGLDQQFGLYEVQRPDQQEEELPLIFISGASIRDNRLYMHVETNKFADDNFGESIEAMKAFATSISGKYCSICGSAASSIGGEPVRCKVCRAREL